MIIKNCTVLLVEDDPNDVILINRAFNKAKPVNPLQVVGDGEQAIDYLAGQGSFSDRDLHPLPALILMDIKLPRKSGLEVLEWLQQQPGLRRLPVVILTSSRETADINRAYDCGANSYLLKPVSFSDLLEIVKNLNLYWLFLNENPCVGDM